MEWSPNPVRTVGVALLGLCLGAAAVLVIADWPGRILVGLAALGLLLNAGYDVVARPRLAAGPDGVVVHTWGGRQCCLPAGATSTPRHCWHLRSSSSSCG